MGNKTMYFAKVKTKETPYDDILSFESERDKGALGSSGK